MAVALPHWEWGGQICYSGGYDHLIRLWDFRVTRHAGGLSYVSSTSPSGTGSTPCSDDAGASSSFSASSRLAASHSSTSSSSLTSGFPGGSAGAPGSVSSQAAAPVSTGASNCAGPPTSAVLSVRGHDGPLSSLELSADDRVLASASYDGCVRLWQGHRLSILRTLSGLDGAPIAHALFSPNHQYLLAVAAPPTAPVRAHHLLVPGNPQADEAAARRVKRRRKTKHRSPTNSSSSTDSAQGDVQEESVAEALGRVRQPQDADYWEDVEQDEEAEEEQEEEKEEERISAAVAGLTETPGKICARLHRLRPPRLAPNAGNAPGLFLSVGDEEDDEGEDEDDEEAAGDGASGGSVGNNLPGRRRSDDKRADESTNQRIVSRRKTQGSGRGGDMGWGVLPHGPFINLVSFPSLRLAALVRHRQALRLLRNFGSRPGPPPPASSSASSSAWPAPASGDVNGFAASAFSFRSALPSLSAQGSDLSSFLPVPSARPGSCFASFWRDRVATPSPVDGRALVFHAISGCLEAALPPLVHPAATITSVAAFPSDHVGLIAAASSAPDAAITLWGFKANADTQE
eukprot:GHVT01091468.1.p1 GENE.GHVT01091468.1~~GHVT01091468.1.p1  ORF type:complete len:650 (-),score=174.64 GHVT01091468.1:220-1938(-)